MIIVLEIMKVREKTEAERRNPKNREKERECSKSRCHKWLNVTVARINLAMY